MGEPSGVERALPIVPGQRRFAWDGLFEVFTAVDPPPRWRSRRRRTGAHLLIALLTLLAVGIELSRPHGGPGLLHQPSNSPLNTAVSLLALAPLPLVGRYPLLGWRIGWVGLLLAVGVPIGADWQRWNLLLVQVPVLLGAFCVAGSRHSRRVLWWMLGLTLGPWWLLVGTEPNGLLTEVFSSILFTVAAVLVESRRSRAQAQQALEVATEQHQLEQARRAVLQERARIARELHDVVAHHMSLIAVRAETAPYRLSGLPEPVQAEFRSLSGAAREALGDMRRLLGVLRQDELAERAPQPGIGDLPGLVEAACQAGVAVELAMPEPADGVDVPASVGVCAYRIVQESLSNAGRHAPGAEVRVRVEQDEGWVSLEIVNGPGRAGDLDAARDAGPRGDQDGAAAAIGEALAPGHGLAGMRERVSLLGGTFAAGPAPDGGFTVRAVLPLALGLQAPA